LRQAVSRIETPPGRSDLPLLACFLARSCLHGSWDPLEVLDLR